MTSKVTSFCEHLVFRGMFQCGTVHSINWQCLPVSNPVYTRSCII
jgi:hypothetical protein